MLETLIQIWPKLQENIPLATLEKPVEFTKGQRTSQNRPG